MATAYRIVLIHQNLVAFEQKVIDAVRKVAENLFGDQQMVDFPTEISETDTPQVLAVLLSDKSCRNAEVNEVIGTAIERRIAILPIIEESGQDNVGKLLPESIAHINAIFWAGDGTEVATTLLDFLGLVERERKLFISYRRSDTAEIAEQLHTKLTQCRFDVFLDRFSIEPGVDFQRRLEDDLGDKAFLLLLESKNLHESRWVRHEIAYALSHRIQILALTLPDINKSNKVSMIDDAFRLRLGYEDLLCDNSLSDKALVEAVARIELEHARALRRRREQILGSVTEKLQQDGCTCKPTGNWSVLASKTPEKTGLFLVTPRRPSPKDFYLLSQQHSQLELSRDCTGLQTSVVHNVNRFPDEHKGLLDWLSSISGSGLNSIESCSL